MQLVHDGDPARLRGDLRPPRRRRLLAGLPHVRAPGDGRGHRPGGVPVAVAQRRPLRPGAAASARGCWGWSTTARSTPSAATRCGSHRDVGDEGIAERMRGPRAHRAEVERRDEAQPGAHRAEELPADSAR